jgi:hypothetical protein
MESSLPRSSTVFSLTKLRAPSGLQTIRDGYGSMNSPNFFTDEDLVVSAVLHSIASGREVTILTRDMGIQEQFVKLWRMIDLHFQGMMFADKFAANRTSFQTTQLVREIPELRFFFADDDGLIVDKNTSDLDSFHKTLLPKNVSINVVYCDWFGGQGAQRVFSPVSFTAISELKRLIQVKGRTGGSNTDALDGFNCHISGFPKGISQPRQKILVVRDNVLNLPTDTPILRIPRLDLKHGQLSD